MSVTLRSLFTVASMLVLAAPLSAQLAEAGTADSEALVASAEQAATAAHFGPTAASVALMLPSSSVSFDATPAATVLRQRTTNNVALMIVGGTALIVGSVVGGDSGTIIMVGGGVVGLIGLYRYLQ